jgi:hypothetical protein
VGQSSTRTMRTVARAPATYARRREGCEERSVVVGVWTGDDDKAPRCCAPVVAAGGTMGGSEVPL